MEIIHVQLSHKRRKVVVLKKLWKYLVRELVRLPHYESVPSLVPAYYTLIFRILYTLYQSKLTLTMSYVLIRNEGTLDSICS